MIMPVSFSSAVPPAAVIAEDPAVSAVPKLAVIPRPELLMAVMSPSAVLSAPVTEIVVVAVLLVPATR
jgi:hypothetical protein